jgi:hypothetical protein
MRKSFQRSNGKRLNSLKLCRKRAGADPPNGIVKLNCGGAFSQSKRSGGWGFISRDYEGNVLSSGYGKLEKVLEPAHAETDAAAVVNALDVLGHGHELGEWFTLGTERPTCL